MANQTSTLLTTGNGYKKIRISNADYSSLFKSNLNRAAASGLQSKSSTKNENQVIVITSLRGAFSPDIPAWVRDEVFDDMGLNQSTISDTELDEPIDPITIDLSAIEIIHDMETQRSAQSKLATKSFNPVDMICPKKWHDETKEKSYDISQIQDIANESYDSNTDNKNKNKNKHQLTASLNGKIAGHGTATAKIFYAIKKRCGIPYKAKFKKADFTTDIDMNGALNVKGATTYIYKDKIFEKHLTLWRSEYEWWIYFFEFKLDLEAAIDLGVDVNATASSEFEVQYLNKGKLGITWTCTRKKCQKTRNENTLRLKNNAPLESFQTSAKINVTPYMDTNFTADLNMYWNAIDIARGKIGVVAALPINIYAYYGNKCSDADADGRQETVDGLLLDAYAELYSYLNIELFNKKSNYAISLFAAVDGYTIDKHYSGTLYTEKKFKATVYRKLVLFKDLLSSGSSILDPVINTEPMIPNQSTIGISTRSCYPYEDAVTYEIDWGDGSDRYIGSDSNVSHTWKDYGPYIISARMTKDSFSRRINSNWTKIKVYVSPDGKTMYYPWLVPVISN